MKDEKSDFLVDIVNNPLPFTEADEAIIFIVVTAIVLVIAVTVWWFRK